MSQDARQLTQPAIEPVTLEEARLWCRIDDDDRTQDAMLLLLIAAARERAEAITERAFAMRTFELRLDEFPELGQPIWIPRPPLVSVESVTYAGADGDAVLSGSPTTFLVDVGGDQLPGRISPLSGAVWPDVEERPAAIRIAFTAGYATGSLMPKTVRLWMQARVSTWSEFREHIFAGTLNDLPRDYVDGLLDNLRARLFFA